MQYALNSELRLLTRVYGIFMSQRQVKMQSSKTKFHAVVTTAVCCNWNALVHTNCIVTLVRVEYDWST